MNDGKKLFLVEDNPDDELLTIRAFRKNSIDNEIVVARDGVEALDWLHGTGPHAGRDTRDLPKVVLLDLKLPRIDGLEVLRRIRAHELTRALPVIILTSSKEEEDVLKSYLFGANSYVRKPVEFDFFIEAVKTLGIYWLQLNETPRSA